MENALVVIWGTATTAATGIGATFLHYMRRKNVEEEPRWVGAQGIEIVLGLLCVVTPLACCFLMS